MSHGRTYVDINGTFHIGQSIHDESYHMYVSEFPDDDWHFQGLLLTFFN